MLNTSFIVVVVFAEELAAMTAATAPRGSGDVGVAAAMIGWLTVQVPTRVDNDGDATTVADTDECWVAATGSALINELILIAVVDWWGFATVTTVLTPLRTGEPPELVATDDNGDGNGDCCFHTLWTGIPYAFIRCSYSYGKEKYKFVLIIYLVHLYNSYISLKTNYI